MGRQPSPEILSNTPPAGARPFGVVTATPSPSTPAGKAGLVLGDALLSFGSARHLRDVQAVLTGSIGKPVVVMLVDAAGRHVRKYVVPAAWDPLAPKSLLGCQMSNQCPADHPAVAGVVRAGRRAHMNGHSTPSRRPPPRSSSSSSGLHAPEHACCARCALILASILQLCLVASIIGLPSVSPGAADLLRLARLDCSAANGGGGTKTTSSSGLGRFLLEADEEGEVDATSTAAAAAAAFAVDESTEAAGEEAAAADNAAVAKEDAREEAVLPMTTPASRATTPAVSGKASSSFAAAAAAAKKQPPPQPLPPTPLPEDDDEEGHEDRFSQVQAAIASKAAATTTATATPMKLTESSSSPPPPPTATTLASLDSVGAGLLTMGTSATGSLLTGLQLDGQLDMDACLRDYGRMLRARVHLTTWVNRRLLQPEYMLQGRRLHPLFCDVATRVGRVRICGRLLLCLPRGG